VIRSDMIRSSAHTAKSRRESKRWMRIMMTPEILLNGYREASDGLSSFFARS
jgi:hypothetical protein